MVCLLSLINLKIAHALVFDDAQVGFSQLLKKTKLAAYVQVRNRRTHLSLDGHRILTEIECEILQDDQMHRVGDLISIIIPGGFFKNYGQIVHGLVSLYPEERVALLLHESSYQQGAFSIVAANAGLFFVDSEEHLIPAHSAVNLAPDVARIDSLPLPSNLHDFMVQAQGRNQ